MSIEHIEPIDVKKPEAEDRQFYSVTTVIGTLDKPALLYWASQQTAEAACDIAGSIAQRIEEDGREAVVKWLRDARFRRPKGRRSATELGTEVHKACEEYALTGQRPEVDGEVAPFLDQFDGWLQRFQPEYEAVETTVYHEGFGYAGTADCFLRLEGELLIGDYKSTRNATDARGNPTGPYSEVALQMAAYANAEMAATWHPRRYEKFRRRYYLLSAEERALAVPVPKVSGGLVIHITPAHCEAYVVDIRQPVFDAFCYCIEAFRWANDLSKTVVKERLVK